MKKGGSLWAKTVLLGGVAAVLVAVVYLLLSRSGSLGVEPGKSPGFTRVLIQRYELKNRSGRLQKDLYFWVRGVVNQGVLNRLLRTESNRDYHEQTDQLGNRIMTFPLEQIPPYGSVIIESKHHLAVGDDHTWENVAQSALEDALRPAPLIESADPHIVKLARSFVQADETQRARAIYDWLLDNIQVSHYQSRALGASKTLQMRKGDCTEFAHLYAALARAAGLPARVMAGYRYRGSAVMRPDDLHNWVEVYLDGNWRVVDAHGRSFLENEADYIAILRLDMHGKGELKGHQRYKISNAAIEVRQF